MKVRRVVHKYIDNLDLKNPIIRITTIDQLKKGDKFRLYEPDGYTPVEEHDPLYVAAKDPIKIKDDSEWYTIEINYAVM